MTGGGDYFTESQSSILAILFKCILAALLSWARIVDRGNRTEMGLRQSHILLFLRCGHTTETCGRDMLRPRFHAHT